jgi:SAM-dependent methyltransferase
MRASTPEHWERYWREHREVEGTYSNEGRILSQLEGLHLQGGRALEVGAGSGRDSLEIARRGACVVLIDYVMESFEVVRSLARNAQLEVHCVCCDACALPFRDGAFDLVFHQGLMEHFRDPLPLLRENHRVTRPGGHCLIDVPQRFHPYTVAKHVLIALNLWFAGWETEFSPGELGRLVRVVGFEVVRIGGDWMVPGFAYRSLRYAMRQVGIARLPKYPREIRGVGRLMRRFREWFRCRRLGPYTFAMLNVLCRKPSV